MEKKMKNKKDVLIGKTFGFWKVIKKVKYKYLCKCVCGKEVLQSSWNFKSGTSKSCGCMRKRKDIIGKTFGKLKVIRIDDKNKYKDRKTRYECLCECGVVAFVTARNLESGNNRSCGCMKPSNREENNLVGRRYGKLLVISLNGINNKKKTWKCICDCGKEKIVDGGHLKEGSTKSCGCLSESYIAFELKRYFEEKYNAISEYRIFRNPKTNRYLPYDIYIPKYKIFIEVNGRQHYERTAFTDKTDDDFKYSQYKDGLKRKYAEENGIYIELDLRTIKNIDCGIKIIEGYII
jgi:hypothetical protein